MSYNEFELETKKQFKQCVSYMSDKEIDTYFKTKEAQDVIRSQYNSSRESATATPMSAASCLSMLC